MIFQQDPDGAFFFLLWILMIFGVVIMILLQIYICVWVHKDAKKRKMDEVVWLIIVLFTGFIGLIIYLIVREPLVTELSEQIPPASQNQPEKNPSHETAHQFCSACGSKISSSMEFCPNCGSKVP